MPGIQCPTITRTRGCRVQSSNRLAGKQPCTLRAPEPFVSIVRALRTTSRCGRRMAPFEITVYSKRTEYLAGLYAGLFELCAAGEVVLDFSVQRPSPAYEAMPTVLRMAVTASGRRLEICLD